MGPGSVAITQSGLCSCPGRGATMPLTYHHFCRLLLCRKPSSERLTAAPFNSCQTHNPTCSIMHVSTRPLTLNLLFQFSSNGLRNLKRMLLTSLPCEFKITSPSSPFYISLLDVSPESSIQHEPRYPGASCAWSDLVISCVFAIQENIETRRLWASSTQLGVHAAACTVLTPTCTMLSCNERQSKSRRDRFSLVLQVLDDPPAYACTPYIYALLHMVKMSRQVSGSMGSQSHTEHLERDHVALSSQSRGPFVVIRPPTCV
jgi:hypothetical protein